MPFASMSKVTSICGTPRGAGAMPPSSKVPSSLLSRANWRSPWYTCTRTDRLVVFGGREDLGRLGRDGRVAFDEGRHHAALGLDAEAQGGDVDEEDVLALALDDAGLEGGADGDDLVGVDALVRLLAAGEFLDELGDGGHAGRAADEDDVVDVGELDSGILDDLLERRLAAVEQVLRHLLELGAGELGVEVDGAVLSEAEVLKGDGGGGGLAEFLLRLLGGLAEALHGGLVLGEVDALLVLDLLDEVVDDALVPVVAAEVVVPVGRLHLDGREVVLVLAHLEQGDVERATTEVEDEDEFVLPCPCRGRRRGRQRSAR